MNNHQSHDMLTSQQHNKPSNKFGPFDDSRLSGPVTIPYSKRKLRMTAFPGNGLAGPYYLDGERRWSKYYLVDTNCIKRYNELYFRGFTSAEWALASESKVDIITIKETPLTRGYGL